MMSASNRSRVSSSSTSSADRAAPDHPDRSSAAHASIAALAATLSRLDIPGSSHPGMTLTAEDPLPGGRSGGAVWMPFRDRPRLEDIRLSTELVEHLNDNLDGFLAPGTNDRGLASVVDNRALPVRRL